MGVRPPSGLVVLAVKREQNHAEALSIPPLLESSRHPLLTTSLIVAETYGCLVSRMGRDGAVGVPIDIDAGIHVVRVAENDSVAGRTILDRYADKYITLTDAVSVAVMDRLRLRTALTFDQRSAQYGLVVQTAG